MEGKFRELRVYEVLGSSHGPGSFVVPFRPSRSDRGCARERGEALFLLESWNGTYRQGAQAARREEEKEAERLYQEAGE